MIYGKQRSKVFWEGVKNNPEYGEIIKQIKTEFEECKLKGIKPLLYSKQKMFNENGNRSEFEDDYFSNRRFLVRSFLLSLLFPDNNEYILNLQDNMWEICNEYNWVVPAHSAANKIDLFSSETGLLLTECIEFLGDRIDKDLKRRVNDEVKRRIVDVYESNEFGWEKYSSNWLAVCTGCIGITLMYAYPEVFDRNIERILKNMQLFLSGFSDEGVCFEGAEYWQYGFGNFVWFADALLQYSEGKINLFDSQKVKKIASYPRFVCLRGGDLLNFADSNRSQKFAKSLIHYLSKIYPDEEIIIGEEFCNFMLTRTNMQNFNMRSFLLDDIGITLSNKGFSDYYLKSAGQAIYNRKEFSFAVKAGNNVELHNHNDVGTFIFADTDGQALCDLGAGMYNREYFNEKRYDILCNSSLGHSVPIINGKPQKAGRSEYCGTIEYNGNKVVLEIAGAYAIDELKSLKRQFEVKDTFVEINDVCEGNISSFTDRFVTQREPVITENSVILGKTEIKFNNNAVRLNVSKGTHINHYSQSEAVWFLDFVPENGKSLSLNMEIKCEEKRVTEKSHREF